MRKIALLRGNKGQAEVVVLVFIGFLVLMALAVKDRPEGPARYYTPSIPTYTPPRSIAPPPERKRFKCVHCNGRGLVKCSLCNGRGGRYNPYDPIDHWSECVHCDGTGLVTCLVCGGSGYW